ncbi:MAG: hypothetical protein V3U75_04175 [Methylococcaceae bacterium]
MAKKEKHPGFVLLIILCFTILGFYVGLTCSKAALKYPEPFTPSKMLRFKPVWKYSGSSEIRIAQAELCRHGIDVKIDGDCGKNTALGMCELLVMIDNGYKIRSIYERKPYGEKESQIKADGS